MKKLIFFIALVICTASVMGQTTQDKKSEQRYEKIDAKTFKASSTTRTSNPPVYTPTGFYYQDREGNRYEIYLHTITRGKDKGKQACYITKRNKPNGDPDYQKIGIKPEELK